MIRGRCPICSRPYAIAALADLPSFPFCSERCRLIDLGRWIDGAYVLPPGQEPPRPAEADPGSETED
jgi:endogenous inhibitor of DNA gyrase (YacG/DUF329 family)